MTNKALLPAPEDNYIGELTRAGKEQGNIAG
jgi:hypothetical protein